MASEEGSWTVVPRLICQECDSTYSDIQGLKGESEFDVLFPRKKCCGQMLHFMCVCGAYRAVNSAHDHVKGRLNRGEKPCEKLRKFFGIDNSTSSTSTDCTEGKGGKHSSTSERTPKNRMAEYYAGRIISTNVNARSRRSGQKRTPISTCAHKTTRSRREKQIIHDAEYLSGGELSEAVCIILKELVRRGMTDDEIRKISDRLPKTSESKQGIRAGLPPSRRKRCSTLPTPGRPGAA